MVSFYFRKVLKTNLLCGYPFYTMLIARHKEQSSMIFAPTIERSVVEKVNKKYPLPTHIPEKLLRNVRNKIIFSKLYNLPLPEKAIHQNRIIELAHTQLAKRFDEVIKRDAKLFIKDYEKMEGKVTYVFDYGMNQIIKETFLSVAKNPIQIKQEDNDILTNFILRNMLIEHDALNDLRFKVNMSNFERQPGFKQENICFADNKKYYDIELICEYYLKNTNKNPIVNAETRKFESLLSTYKKI